MHAHTGSTNAQSVKATKHHLQSGGAKHSRGLEEELEGRNRGGLDLNTFYARIKFSNDNSDDDDDDEDDDATSRVLPRHTSGCESVSWGHCPMSWGSRLNQKGLKDRDS